MDWRSLELAGLIAAAGLLDVAAGTALSCVAGFGEVRSVLSRVDWPWLAAMAGALCVSFAGYHAAYRGIYRAEGGFRLPRGRLLAVVMAGFSGLFAHGGRTPDDLALQQAGADPRESYVRAGTLGGMEQGVLALSGCAAALVVLARGLAVPAADVTWPWAIIPVPAAVLVFWGAGRYVSRLRDGPGWRGHVSVLLDSVRLAAVLFGRPLRHRGALGGMFTFWAAEIFAVWARTTPTRRKPSPGTTCTSGSRASRAVTSSPRAHGGSAWSPSTAGPCGPGKPSRRTRDRSRGCSPPRNDPIRRPGDVAARQFLCRNAVPRARTARSAAKRPD